MANKKLVIIDTDCGVDDAVAILYALRDPLSQVLAITCTFGNCALDKADQNVLRVLNYAGTTTGIPVYRGCKMSLLGAELATSFHGTDGFGGVASEYPTGEAKVDASDHASNALIKLVDKYPGQITLVVLGPLTNVAVALSLDPGFTKNLKELIIMGGNIQGQGNAFVAAEFNFACDPEAASVVLLKTECPIKIVPLETCYCCGFTWDHLNQLVNQDNKFSHLFKNVTAVSRERVKTKLQRPRYHCCDLLAMVVAIHPEFLTRVGSYAVDVELAGKFTRGMLVVDYRTWLENDNKKVDIVLQVSDDWMQLISKVAEDFL